MNHDIAHIERYIEDERTATADRIEKYLALIIEAEFHRVRKHNPSLKEIIFGNGTYTFVFEPDVELLNCVAQIRSPPHRIVPHRLR